MDDFFAQVWDTITTLINPLNLLDPDKLQKALQKPGAQWAVLVSVAAVIFTETGLLVGFLLPGDSLLVFLGVAIHLGGWELWPFLVVLSVAAIIGDTVGYAIGWRAGPAIFN
ncbi:MAG: hypothetical protein K2V38_13100, partial [Gemmataceae bacterium]|nr:hypothetical protein [Gemmataceae bacterium]